MLRYALVIARMPRHTTTSTFYFAVSGRLDRPVVELACRLHRAFRAISLKDANGRNTLLLIAFFSRNFIF